MTNNNPSRPQAVSWYETQPHLRTGLLVHTATGSRPGCDQVHIPQSTNSRTARQSVGERNSQEHRAWLSNPNGLVQSATSHDFVDRPLKFRVGGHQPDGSLLYQFTDQCRNLLVGLDCVFRERVISDSPSRRQRPTSSGCRDCDDMHHILDAASNQQRGESIQEWRCRPRRTALVALRDDD